MSAIDQKYIQKALEDPERLRAIAVAAAKVANQLESTEDRTVREYNLIRDIADSFDVMYF